MRPGVTYLDHERAPVSQSIGLGAVCFFACIIARIIEFFSRRTPRLIQLAGMPMDKFVRLLTLVETAFVVGCDPASNMTLLIRPIDMQHENIGSDNPITSLSNQDAVVVIESFMQKHGFEQVRTCEDSNSVDLVLAEACLEDIQSSCVYASQWHRQSGDSTERFGTHVDVCVSGVVVRVDFMDAFRFRISESTRDLSSWLRMELLSVTPNLSIEIR